MKKFICVIILFIFVIIIPCMAKDRCRRNRYHPGMYKTGNYLHDLNRYRNKKKFHQKRMRYFLKYKINKHKSYRPASKSRARYIRIRK